MLPFFGSNGFQPPWVSPRITRMMSTGSTPRMRAHDVLAVRREEVVLRARGAGRADLGGLLPEARRPQRELALPLQVGGLQVERADDDHVAVEALELGVGECVDRCARYGSAAGVGANEPSAARTRTSAAGRLVGRSLEAQSPFHASPRPEMALWEVLHNGCRDP